MGINILSKKIKKRIRSKTENAAINKPSINKKRVINNFKSFFIETKLDNKQIGVKKVVSIIKKIDKPSTPKCKCIFQEEDQKISDKN